MRPITCLAALAFAFAVASGHAAEPDAPDAAHRQLALEVIGLLGVEQSITPVAAQITASIAEQIDSLGVPDERRPLVDDYMARLDALLTVGLAWPSLEADFSLLYVETFTPDELRALRDFLASPGGRKYVAETPSLTRRSAVLVEQHVRTLQPQIEALLLSLQGEMRESASTPAPAAASP